jgi:hypothetical protein
VFSKLTRDLEVKKPVNFTKISNSFSGLPLFEDHEATHTASGETAHVNPPRATSPDQACVDQILPRGDTCLQNYGSAQMTPKKCRDATFQRREVKSGATGLHPKPVG